MKSFCENAECQKWKHNLRVLNTQKMTTELFELSEIV